MPSYCPKCGRATWACTCQKGPHKKPAQGVYETFLTKQVRNAAKEAGADK